MLLLHEAAALRAHCDELRQRGSVGLVLTMGALHEGHLTLMRRAREQARSVVATVFVNPTQFGPNEDLDRYPRELELDAEKCASAGVDVLFAPSVAEMYPSGEQTRVRVGALAERLCGSRRPGHFEGVCTIVAKFFSLCAPCVSVFGEKDFQQLRVLQRMSKDLLLPVEVLGAPIVREADGLAMSSRNRYLSKEQRRQALALPRALAATRIAYRNGERSVDVLERIARDELSELDIEYAEVVDERSLQRLVRTVAGDARVMLAAQVGATRLIDNGSLDELGDGSLKTDMETLSLSGGAVL